MLDKTEPVLFVEVYNHLAVAAGPEPVAAAHEACPQLTVIENLAIANDPYIPGLVPQRLLSAGRVHDAQARIGQPDAVAKVESCCVRAAMLQQRNHCLQLGTLHRCRRAKITDTGDSAHNVPLTGDRLTGYRHGRALAGR